MFNTMQTFFKERAYAAALRKKVLPGNKCYTDTQPHALHQTKLLTHGNITSVIYELNLKSFGRQNFGNKIKSSSTIQFQLKKIII